ncbi:MAG: arginine deiminase [Gemmatimonadota bacterium]|nr:MAG: arginine deiminase [Gemmatimonadota bacterium]
MSSPNITSEIGRLRQVLVHRPGLELARLTPQNKEALLFDDILWVERAQEEHDAFVEILRSRDVEVLYFRDMLEATLADQDVRDRIVNEVITPATCGLSLSERIRPALRECSIDDLTDVLLGGLLKRELGDWDIDDDFAKMHSDRFHYIIPPLPNLFFMRDNAAWIGDGVLLSVLATPARAREARYLRAIYKYHPRFREEDFKVWYGNQPEDVYPGCIEGGDVLVLDEKTVLIGCGARTSPAAVDTVSRRLFERSSVENVILVQFRKGRAIMHLDTVFTMVDVNKFNFFPGVLRGMEVFIVRRGQGSGFAVQHADDLESALRQTLRRDDLKIIASGTDEIEYIREQWDDGHNTFALAPGVVVAYARNAETNQRLRDAGVEVLELDASELCRGRGGSRCMTQPIRRDPVQWDG